MGESELTRSTDPLLTLARELGSRALKSGSGLGALRKLDSVAAETVRLILDSSIFERRGEPIGSSGWGPWLGLDPDDFFHFMHHSRHRGHFVLDLIGGALPHPASFDPRPMWALFWALVKAEHEFLARFLPYWSHEERLTGHLISLMMERIREFNPHWTLLGDGLMGGDAKKLKCELEYFDTATARQEQVTGADLGLVIHAEFPWHEEFFKAVRFQAKKADTGGKAVVDLEQTQALMSLDNLGYYVFYHQPRAERGTPCPTVRAAAAFKYQLDEAVKAAGPGMRSRRELGSVTVDALNGGWDFASFVTFAVADPASSYGVLRDSPEGARSAVIGGGASGPPSRLLVVTLGSPPAVDWDHMFDELTRPRG